MNVYARPPRTLAEEALSRAYTDARLTLPGNGAVQAKRDAWFKQFEARGLPHRRIEQWKYTDLRAFMHDAKPLASLPDAAAKDSAAHAGAAFSSTDARRLVFSGGSFVPELSDIAGLETGLSITPMSEALARGDADVMTRLSAESPAGNDPAFCLNSTFMSDGAVITVAPCANIARPIHLVFVAPGDQATAMFTRSLVTLGERASLTVFETHEGPNGIDYQESSAFDVVLDEEAVLNRVRIGAEGSKALHVATCIAALGKSAELHDSVLTTGGALIRNQMFVRCDGEGSKIDLSGASLLAGTQHADTTLVIDHAVGGCESRELFKSILDGEARSVFQGKIIVRKDAQKTDGRMMTQALLLSEDAEADAKPELEIFADDVQCGHGATTGELDETLKFYLMARGIPAQEAEAMLIESFVGEVIDTIAHEGARAAVHAAMMAKLQARG